MEELLKSKRTSLLASLVSQNMTLKMALIVIGCLMGVETFALIALGLRKPIVVGLTNSGPEVLPVIENEKMTAPQVRAFIFEVLARKFPPRPSAERLLVVCPFFTEGLKAACEKEIRDKKSFIPQDFVVKELVWNDKTETARIQLKRFANFGGSVTTVESLLALQITQRSRTVENPWGLFVASWKEEVH